MSADISVHFPVQIINRTNEAQSFRFHNKDNDSDWIHVDYTPGGHHGEGEIRVDISPGGVFDCRYHLFVEYSSLPTLDPDSPGNMNVFPYPGHGSITLGVQEKFSGPGSQDKTYYENLVMVGSNYDGEGVYNFGIFYDESGNRPIEVFDRLSPGTSIYYIFTE